MFTLKYAKDPIWNSDDGQQIHLTVRFEEINEDLPFNATSFDSEPHGVNLYNRAKAGEFGEIAPYVALQTLTQPQTTETQSA
jgi:hypothetical protein